jgi:ABC-type spermidine/putrescine transport system permease subunit I
LSLPVTFLVAFAVIPIAFIFVWSFWRYEAGNFIPAFTTEHYEGIVNGGRIDPIVFTLRTAVIVIVLDLALAFPVSYYIYRYVSENRKVAFVILLVIPFAINRLLRLQALSFLLSRNSVINQLVFFVDPVSLGNSELGMIIGFLNDTLPIGIAAIWLSLERIDESLLHASYDMGASRFDTFRWVILPLSSPGVAATSILVFVLVMGSAQIPDQLGGSGVQTVGQMLFSTFNALQFPLAGAISLVVLAMIGVLILIADRYANLMALFQELE